MKEGDGGKGGREIREEWETEKEWKCNDCYTVKETEMLYNDNC